MMLRMKRRFKRNKKREKRLRFFLKLLSKNLRYKRYGYRNKHFYNHKYYNYHKHYTPIKSNKVQKITKIKVKIKNKIKIIKITKQKVKAIKKQSKLEKTVRILRDIQNRNYNLRKKIKKILHLFKRKLLPRNEVVKRKKRRRFFWLTRLHFYKQDIKHAACFALVYNPALLQYLLHTKLTSNDNIPQYSLLKKKKKYKKIYKKIRRYLVPLITKQNRTPKI
jgi:hypothetical protein